MHTGKCVVYMLVCVLCICLYVWVGVHISKGK